MNNELETKKTEAKTIVSNYYKQILANVGGEEHKEKASKYMSSIIELTANKNLKDCNVEDVVKVAIDIVNIGLNPNPIFNEAYVVPYQIIDKKTKQVTATIPTLQIGAKGYVTLAYKGGWRFATTVVYGVDEFIISLDGFGQKFQYAPNYDKHDDTNGDWVKSHLFGVVVSSRDAIGIVENKFVSAKKIEQLRLSSPNQNNPAKYEHIWHTWSVEMVQAKALKYVAKRQPISDNLLEAIALDEKNDKIIDIKANEPKPKLLP